MIKTQVRTPTSEWMLAGMVVGTVCLLGLGYFLYKQGEKIIRQGAEIRNLQRDTSSLSNRVALVEQSNQGLASRATAVERKVLHLEEQHNQSNQTFSMRFNVFSSELSEHFRRSLDNQMQLESQIRTLTEENVRLKENLRQNFIDHEESHIQLNNQTAVLRNQVVVLQQQNTQLKDDLGMIGIILAQAETNVSTPLPASIHSSDSSRSIVVPINNLLINPVVGRSFSHVIAKPLVDNLLPLSLSSSSNSSRSFLEQSGRTVVDPIIIYNITQIIQKALKK